MSDWLQFSEYACWTLIVGCLGMSLPMMLYYDYKSFLVRVIGKAGETT